MARAIVVLSGPIASGKSTFASAMVSAVGATYIRTRDLLLERAEGKVSAEREALQKFGDRLDRATKGQWLAQELTKAIADMSEDVVVVVDAVRMQLQIDALREAFGRSIFHIHLTASEEELAKRFADTGTTGLKEPNSYSAARKNPTEAAVEKLSRDADLVIDTARNRAEDVVARVLSRLPSPSMHVSPSVDVLVGGQFGSEGKGNIAFYLAPDYDVLVRVGGPNAGHKVPLDTPITHRMLPSGTMSAPSTTLVIGPGAVLDGEELLAEIARCEVEAPRLRIDPGAIVISSSDKEEEKADLVGRIGSTGSGVGVATSRRVLRKEDLKTVADVEALKPYLEPSIQVLERAYRDGKRILLEGTQGTGLSLYHGYFPHVTSRDTTAAGCLAEAGIPPARVRRIVMVCRTYPIRVQNPKKGTSGLLPAGDFVGGDFTSKRHTR